MDSLLRGDPENHDRIRLDLIHRFRRFQVAQCRLSRETWSTFRVAVEGYDLPYLVDSTERLRFLGTEIPRITEGVYEVICDAADTISRCVERGDRRTALAHYNATLHCVQRYEELINSVLSEYRQLPRRIRDDRRHE